MGKTSVLSGKAFERAVADRLRKWWPGLLVKRGAQSAGACEPDLVISLPSGLSEDGRDIDRLGNTVNIPRQLLTLWFELECSKAPSPRAKLAQARRDLANTKLLHDRFHFMDPVIIWRKKGSVEIKATVELGTLCRLGGYRTNGNGDPGGWATPCTLGLDDLFELLRGTVTE